MEEQKRLEQEREKELGGKQGELLDGLDQNELMFDSLRPENLEKSDLLKIAVNCGDGMESGFLPVDAGNMKLRTVDEIKEELEVSRSSFCESFIKLGDQMKG